MAKSQKKRLEQVWLAPSLLHSLHDKLPKNPVTWQKKIRSVDSRIARAAAQLGRTRKTKLPDLIIAATAIEFDIPLITKNVKDFRNIPRLRIQTTLT